MTYAMVAKLTFAKHNGRDEIIIKRPNAVTVKSGWKMLTDTATITLPRNVDYFDKHNIKSVFRVGDPVTIELGYNGVLVKEFEGYVTKISADIPIIIECQDEMWKLKRIPVNISLPKTSLKNLLTKITSGYNVDALEVEIGAQRFPNTTVAKVLEFLKQEYSLYSYMKGKQLVCGKIYQDDSDRKPINIHLEKYVVNNGLNYKRAEDVLIKIKAISTLFDGRKLEVEVGESQGEIKQLSYYGIELEAELKKIALEDLKKYKVDSLKGDIETFGFPFVQHGDKVEIVSDLYEDRTGIYYVEEVETVFDDSPQYHRKIKLGDKVAA